MKHAKLIFTTANAILSRPVFKVRISAQLSQKMVRELEMVPWYRRFFFGLWAFIASMPFAICGTLVVLAPPKNWTISIVQRLGFGSGLLSAAAAMFLIGIRFWFGKRENVEAALRYFLQTGYVYFLLGVCLLFGFIVFKIQTI